MRRMETDEIAVKNFKDYLSYSSKDENETIYDINKSIPDGNYYIKKEDLNLDTDLFKIVFKKQQAKICIITYAAQCVDSRQFYQEPEDDNYLEFNSSAAFRIEKGVIFVSDYTYEN